MGDSMIDARDGYADPPPSNSSYLPITPPSRRRQIHDELLKDPPTYHLTDIPPCATVESQYELPDAGHNDVPEIQGSCICECCPKKPRRFDTVEELRLHESERSYTCAYCPSRFKKKTEYERHQGFLHIRRYAWSCAALIESPTALSYIFSPRREEFEVCGYCGKEFLYPLDRVLRAEHLNQVHKISECNQAKVFFREEHFRQHLKHSHAATIGEWTDLLVNASKKDVLPRESSSTAAQHNIAPSIPETTTPDLHQQIYITSPDSRQHSNNHSLENLDLLGQRALIGEPKVGGNSARNRVFDRIEPQGRVIPEEEYETCTPIGVSAYNGTPLDLGTGEEEPASSRAGAGSKMRNDEVQNGRKNDNEVPLHPDAIFSNAIRHAVSATPVTGVSLELEQLPEISQHQLSTTFAQTEITMNKKDDNSFKDSGYASISRASRSVTQSTSEQRQTTVEKTELPDVREEDDIQSIISDESHIGSNASVQTSATEHEGKAYFARFLADDKNLRTLLEPLLHRMGIGRFSNTMRKLLKVYYKSLSRTANTERERVSVALLKSRRGRRRIGELIAGYLSKNGGNNDDDDNDVDSATTSNLAGLRMSLLENWLANIRHKPVDEGESQGSGSKIHLKHRDANNRSQGKQMEHSDISSESDDDEHAGFSYLIDMQTFFRDSVAFGELVQSLTALVLPHAIAQIVLSTRKDSIYISQEADVSLSNKWKGQVERFTHVEWDWWPLSPHMRDLQPSESRIHWTCVCGTKLWKEINHEEAALINATLPYLADTPLWPHRCRPKDQRSFLQRLYRFLAHSQSSSAQKRYTPQTSGTSQSCAASNIARRAVSQGALSSAVQGSSTQQGSIANHFQPSPHANISTPNNFWILLGVQGRRKPLDMSHIPVLQQNDDSSFYRTLKSNYRRSRGRLRLWFSFWKLEYCEVVKFKRIASLLVIRERKELPLEQEYEYSPRPPNPNATNPTITRHEFSMHLNACEEPCRWAAFHECMPQLKTTHTIETIPKRCQQFSINSNDSKDMFAWGLEAKHVVSARHLVVYHLVAFMVPFGLFIWWMIAFNGDIQGAAVPAAVFIGAVSLFWSTSGVLIQSRQNNDGFI